MTLAAAIVEELRARAPAPLLEKNTGMPYGWAIWLKAMAETPGRIVGATAGAVVSVLTARPLRPIPARAAALGRIPAFFAVFRQNWEPAPYDERWLRRFAVAFSITMHLLLAVILAWLAFVYVPLPPPPPDEAGSRVQLQIVGKGTPQTVPSPLEATDSPTPPTPAVAATRAAAAPPGETPATPAEAPAAVPDASQPVQLTNVPEPTSDYVLPPPIARDVQTAPRALEALPVNEREVTVAERPQPRSVETRTRVVAAESAVPVVHEREVPMPVQAPAPRVAQSRPVQAPALEMPAPTVREREVPAPTTATPTTAVPATPAVAAAPAPAPMPAPAPAPVAAPAAAPSPAPAAPAAAGAPARAAPRVEKGDPDKDWSLRSERTSTLGDDWGDAKKAVAGTAGPGGGSLFNSDGSVKLPGKGNGTGTVSGNPKVNGPPGGAKQQQVDIDRAGKWLKRPDSGYTPTKFDKYWVPNETLLQEWVRRSVQSVSIPIPGTSKSIDCSIVVLMAGGACGISDSNLNDQPAVARPPPDIPFKRELQEDNGANGPQAPIYRRPVGDP